MTGDSDNHSENHGDSHRDLLHQRRSKQGKTTLALGLIVAIIMFVGGVGIVEFLRLPDSSDQTNHTKAVARSDNTKKQLKPAVVAPDKTGKTKQTSGSPASVVAPPEMMGSDDSPDPRGEANPSEAIDRDTFKDAVGEDKRDNIDTVANDINYVADDMDDPVKDSREPADGDPTLTEDAEGVTSNKPSKVDPPWWEKCREKRCTLNFGDHNQIIFREGRISSDREIGYRPFRDNKIIMRLYKANNPSIIAHHFGFHSRTKKPSVGFVTVSQSGRSEAGVIPLRLGPDHIEMNPSTGD